MKSGDLNKVQSNDTMHQFANIVSLILNPTTLGGIAFTLFSRSFGGTGSEKLIWFLISFGFGILIPLLYLIYLKSKNLVEAIDVPIRTQRTIPYLLAALSYAIGFTLLVYIAAPWQLVALMTVFLINTLIIAGINSFWKISTHAMGTGSIVTAFGIVFSPLYFLGLILLPVVSWSRIQLDRHSFWQVVIGSILSVPVTALQFALIKLIY